MTCPVDGLQIRGQTATCFATVIASMATPSASTAGMQITEVLTAPQAPWQSPYVERLIGSIRRECLDHVIILSVESLRRILQSYITNNMIPAVIYGLTRIHRKPEKFSHPTRASSSRFQRSAGFIIVTNDAQPEHLLVFAPVNRRTVRIDVRSLFIGTQSLASCGCTFEHILANPRPLSPATRLPVPNPAGSNYWDGQLSLTVAEIVSTTRSVFRICHASLVLPSSSVAGIDLSFYEAGYYRRICLQQF